MIDPNYRKYRIIGSESMRKELVAILVVSGLGAVTTIVSAADELEFSGHIEARQSLMTLYKFNLGVLGAMARERTPYDADTAKAAADNMLAISNMKNGAMWPAGSDMSAEGYEGETWAKPENWSNYAEVSEKAAAMNEALEALAAEAGTGLDGVRSNLGAVGNACKGCHESFRADKE
jgi:cytochrome c556